MDTSFIKFIDDSPSPYHAIEKSSHLLEQSGFQRLHLEHSWTLEKGGKYYCIYNGSALIAFKFGSRTIPSFRIVTSHSDSPSFRIKPLAKMKDDHYLKLNTESYGSPIFSTWFDRTLSIAGRVFLEGDDPFHPLSELIDIEEDLLTIPNLAIHMNPQINKGQEINPQKDTLPLLGLINDEIEKLPFREILEKKLNKKKKIIGFDLNLYDRQKGSILGIDKNLVHVGKLDNLATAYAAIQALIHCQSVDGSPMVCIFDHEEIGSGSRQGALSPILSDIIKRICFNRDSHYETFSKSLAGSFMISADQAHGAHPNYPDKADPTHKPIINQGPVIKVNSAMNYSTDGYTSAVIESIAKQENIPLQYYTNRSDIRGGSTLGPLISRHLNIPSVDLGNPIFAMHSIRELGGIKDQLWLEGLFTSFLSY